MSLLIMYPYCKLIHTYYVAGLFRIPVMIDYNMFYIAGNKVDCRLRGQNNKKHKFYCMLLHSRNLSIMDTLDSPL